MLHDHEHRPLRGQHELRLAMAITAVMMVMEFVGGWISGSLSLIADAGHMFTDMFALGLSLFAAWLASKPATPGKTYGYYRTEILAALANGIALCLIVIWIYAQAFHRLMHPVDILTGPMLLVAGLGLMTNLTCVVILWLVKNRSLNVQAAWLNVVSDTLGSIGVIIAGCLIRWFGFRVADPIASTIIGVFIAISAWKILKQSVNILLEGTPGHLRIPQVVGEIREISGVHDVHDIHLWTITTGIDAMSGHIVVDDVTKSTNLLSSLGELLSKRFGITHTTFQLEPRTHTCRDGTSIASA